MNKLKSLSHKFANSKIYPFFMAYIVVDVILFFARFFTDVPGGVELVAHYTNPLVALIFSLMIIAGCILGIVSHYTTPEEKPAS